MDGFINPRYDGEWSRRQMSVAAPTHNRLTTLSLAGAISFGFFVDREAEQGTGAGTFLVVR